MKPPSWSRTPTLAILFALTLSAGVSQVSLSWKGKVTTQDGVSIVDNPEKPCGGELRLELRESLIITERSADCSFGSLSSVFVDDDAAGDEGFIAVAKLPLEAGGNDQALVVFDSAGKTKKVLAQSKDQMRVVEKDKRGKERTLVAYHPFNPYLRLCSYGEGFIYGYPSEYKFHVCEIDGTPRRVVRKREPPRPIRREDKEDVISYTDRFLQRQGMPFTRNAIEAALQFPDSRPFYDAITADRTGRVLVFKTAVSEKGEADVETCLIDIFDAEGRFLYAAVLPFRPEFVKGDRIYDLSVDKSGDPVIRRLEILNPARGGRCTRGVTGV